MADPIHILHVDDDAEFGEMVAKFLEREKDTFSITSETRPRSGLELVDRDPPDCIVSDFDMPEQNGIEFLRSIREIDADLPFILFTGKGSEEVASEAITAGATDYLQKTSNTDQYKLLANRIENTVQQHRAQKQLETERERIEFALDSTHAGVWTRDFTTNELETHPETCPVFNRPITSFEEFIEGVHPADRKRLQRTIARATEKGDSFSVQFRVSDEDGTRWGEMTAKTVLEDGEPILQTGITRNITPQKEHQRRFETLTSNLPGIVYRCKNTPSWPMEQVWGDAESLLGYTTDELKGNELEWGTDIIHPEDQMDTWEAVSDQLSDGESFQITYRVVTREGETKWVWERGHGMYAPDGELEALEGFITDITDRYQREQRVNETKRQLEAVLNTVEAAVFIKDTDGYYQLMNPRCREIFGVSLDVDVTQLTDYDLVSEDLADTFRAGDQLAIEAEETIELEENITISGESGTWLTLKSPLYDENDDIIGVCAVSTDISEWKQQEAERRQNERRFQALFDDPNLLVGLLDTDGTVLDVNDTALRYVDADRDTVSGMHMSETSWWNDQIREDVEGWIDAAAAGEYVEFEADHTDHELSADISVVGTVRPVTDENGAVVSLVISARKKAATVRSTEYESIAAESLDSYAFYRTLIGQAPEGVLTIDADSKIVYANAATESILGYTPDELIGTSKMELIPDRLQSDHRDALDAYIESGDRNIEWDGVELPALHKDGYEVPTLISLQEHELNGEVYFTGIVRDITERKKRDNALDRQRERLEEFAELLTHDIRNPLSVASGYVELIQSEHEIPELDHVSESLASIDQLVSNVLELSRKGQVIGERQRVSVDEQARTGWAHTSTRNASFLIKDGLGFITADGNRLQELFGNLFRNAIEHGGEDVTVSMGRLDDTDGYYIADDGPGIPTSIREDVFDRGFSTETKGTGYGLTIVQQIVDAHGWEISVTDSDSGGARFEIARIEILEE